MYADTTGWECASVTVPLDYGHPDGRQIQVSIGRRPAADPSQRIGSLVWLQSMVPASSIGAGQIFGPTILRQFDLIGFDARGIGTSEAVRCLDKRPALEHPYPRTAADLAAFEAAAKAVDVACAQNSGWLLPYLGIENVARDLDRIRGALGEDRITLAGNNWAGTLDAVYADLFPSHVRAAVLGGPFLPGIDDEALLRAQAIASQAALNRFLSSCATDAGCAFHSGGRPRQAFDAVMARLTRAPGAGLSERDAWLAVWLGLMGADSDLARALAAAASGDYSILKEMVDWSGLNDAAGMDQYDAYNCMDYARGRTPQAYAELAARLRQIAPDFGGMLAYGDFGCAYWPAPPNATAGTLSAAGAPPIVIVAARDDPQTPYAWSVELSRQLPSAALLTVESAAVSTIYSDSQCARQAVDHYLLTLEPPATGSSCR